MQPTRQKPRPAAMGMLFGVWIGGGAGVLAFVFTQDPVWFVLGGIGAAMGLGMGAAVERRSEVAPEPRKHD